MESIQNFGDERVPSRCAYCGGLPDTRDHIPPRVFLDDPLPRNVHVVGSCWKCNNGAALDEEYVASLVECARLGTTDPRYIERDKVRRIFVRSPALTARIERDKAVTNNEISFTPEGERLRRVFLKLARAHAVYEENVTADDDPSSFAIMPLHLLSHEQRSRFEAPPTSSAWPEVGSRAMQRILVGDHGVVHGWVVVQPQRYRFCSASAPLTVRIVVSEYIACEVVWD